MINDEQKQLRDIPEVYVSDFNRLAKSVEARCSMTGETCSPGEIETQIALRAAIMKIASLRRELTSIRAVVAYFLEEETWPLGIEDRDWLNKSDMEEVGQLHSGLVRTGREFAELGEDVSANMVTHVMEMNFPGSEEDAARALSGMQPERTRRKTRDKKSMTIITDRDFMELELHLADHPHQNALKTLSKKRTDSKALLRIFMRAIRLTGMRPVEVFSCRLYVGNPEREYSAQEVRDAYDKPFETALLKRSLISIDELDPRPWGSMTAMVRNTFNLTGIPPILLIESAKTTNANPDLSRPFRAQVLKNIEDDDLEVLSLAAHLHHFRIDKKRRSNLITTMTRNLSTTADKALPHRKDTLNLYSFRHDFATRARIRLQVWEVAALMGHTAKASTYAYGKRNTRKKGGSSSAGGWMPLQDAEFAEAIREKWGAAPDAAPQVDARQALDNAFSIENSIQAHLPER